MRGLYQAALSALVLTAFAGAAKINTPRVLLPWIDANTRVNFTFEISEGGCYTWSLSRDDLISLEPLYEDSWGHCSRSALVSPLPSCSLPGSVIILAEDVITGEIIRGDLNVDRIRSLRISSTTWKLYLEEAPEAFEVEVFDEHGNKFSTLEGVEFNWTVENVEEDEEPVVKLVWWADTDYEAPPGIYELESVGRRSYLVLLYGQTMGEAKVKVCLNTTCAEVALRVVASVILQPSIAIIAPGDSVRFKVVRARRGKLTVEDVGDTLYRLRVPDDGITYLEDGVSLVQGRAVGTATISLTSGSTEVATSTVTVSNPHSIRVILRPSELLVRGEYFVIRALVLDKQERALTAGEKMLVRLSVDGDADVNLIQSTENGTLTDAIANSEGSVTITAHLHSVGGKTLANKVQGSVQAIVVEPLQVIPPELFIAWTDIPIEVQLEHRGGGDGPVSYSAERTSGRVLVGSGGEVRAESLGRATVRAHLTQHTHVQASAEVWVLEAQYVQVASSGNARVGRPHALHVALTGTHPDTGRLFTFHKCDCNSFAVTLLEGPEPQNITAATWIEPLEGACCVLTGVWTERGACALRVSRGHMGDTARVLVRAGPKLVWPQSAAMLVGASIPVLAAGEALQARTADPSVSQVRQRAPPSPRAYPDLQTFTITCSRKGETALELQSKECDEDGMEGGGSAAIACAPRVSKIRLETSAATECSGGVRLWVRAGGRAVLSVTLFDAAGRELLDELGHRVTWDTNPGHSALEYTSPNRLMVLTDPEYDPVPVPVGYYQELVAGETAAGWTGTIRATAGDASATIHAHVVAPLVVNPQYVNVAFEGTTASQVATITGGSGRYAVEAQKGAAAILEAGRLSATWPTPGRYELTVADSCLADEAVTVVARVEEISTVEVSGPRSVCVNTCVPFTATAYGASGRALSSSSAPEWTVTSGARVTEGQLCGIKEGIVVVKAAIAGVWSSEFEVAVFPVLGIRPERVRVPPGARLQLAHTGGPGPRRAILLYSSLRAGDTINVHQNGLLTALRVGSGRVRLVARDRDGNEIASAEAEVEVVEVTGVRGVSASSTVLIGAEVPLWLEAAPGLGPEALAPLHPAPRVLWTLREPGAAILTVPLRAIQLTDKSTAEGLAVRLTPLREGPITVDITVQNFVQGDETRTFNTVVEISAVPDLSAYIDGHHDDINSGSIAVAVGATVQLRSSLRARWRAVTSDEPAFELSPSGELKALRPGFGVAIGRYRDERNNYEREATVHVEVATPHYVMAQSIPDDEGTAVRVEARSALGRRLLAHNLTLTPHARLSFHPRSTAIVAGPEVVVSGVDASGTFTQLEASTGTAVLRDYVWLPPPDRSSERITTGGGHAVCLSGGGWHSTEGVWLGERGGVTLAVPQGRGAGRLALKAERPPRTVTIILSPVTKMEFIPGEWPAALVPLSLETATGSATIDCTDEERSAVAELEPVLPFVCQTSSPYSTKPLLDTFLGQIGCSITSDSPLTEAVETEVCAEWDTLHACTRVLLLPPVRLTRDRLTLADRRETFTVTGHPSALKSVTVSASPGLKTQVESSSSGLEVSVWSEERECGSGWVWVRAKRTAQVLTVQVTRECEATCCSLLSVAVSLVRAYFSTLLSAGLAAAGAVYLYTKMTVTSGAPDKSVLPQPPRPVLPLSPTRTWQHSPYAPPRPPPSPPSPVYGDTTILPDSNYSPNSSAQQHSRFL